MDNIVFYNPSFTSSHGSKKSERNSASLPNQRNESQLNERNDLSRDQVHQTIAASHLLQEGPCSSEPRRSDTITQQGLMQNSSHSDVDRNSPNLDKLSSGALLTTSLLNDYLDGNKDNGFLDIDDFILERQQESTEAAVDLISRGMTEKMNEIQGSHPADYNCSNASDSHDPIGSGEDKSATKYTSTEVSLLDENSPTAPAPAPDYELADRDSSIKTINHVSRNFTTDCLNACKESKELFEAQLQLQASCSHPASPEYHPNIQEARKAQMNIDIAQGRTNYPKVNATKVLGKGQFESFVDVDNSYSGDCFTDRFLSPAISSDASAFDNDIYNSQDELSNDYQSPGPGLATAVPRQSDSQSEYSTGKLHCPNVAGNVRRKRQRKTKMSQVGDLTSEYDPHDNDNAMSNFRDRDNDKRCAAAGTSVGGRVHSRKRVKQTKATNDDTTGPFPFLDALPRVSTATSIGDAHGSEEVPVHGYLSLKTIDSKVIYCLTISQEILSGHQKQGYRPHTITDLEPYSVVPDTEPSILGESHQIIGQKIVGDEKFYQVASWVPRSKLIGEEQLVGPSKATAERHNLPKQDTVFDTRASASRESVLSNLNDDQCSSKDERDTSVFRMNIPWEASDEERLRMWKMEGRSWDWIFKQLPGRTPAAVRTRWTMVQRKS